MPESYERKRFIADTFMQLVAESPDNHRTTVVDITNNVGISRKLFYNYFVDINDLVIWIVRDSFKNIVETVFAKYPQIKPDPSLNDPYPDWPFYTRIASDNHFLEQGAFFKSTTYHWEDNRAYYERLFHDGSNNYINLFNYLVRIFVPALRDDVIYMLNGRELSPVAIDFLAEYHTMGIFGRLNWHFGQTRKFIMQDDLLPFWNHAHISIRNMIDIVTDTEGKSSTSLDLPSRTL